MYKISTEGTTFFYDIDFQYKEKKENEIIISQDALNYIDKKELKRVVRPVLTEHYSNKNVFFVDYLYWFNNNFNIEHIDCKILNGNYTNIDFKYSIKTRYINNLSCLNCSSTYKSLVIDPVIIYPGNFELTKEKKKLLNDTSIKCLNCHSNFTVFVIYIFE